MVLKEGLSSGWSFIRLRDSNVHCMILIRSHINISFPLHFKTVIKPGCLPAYSLESFLFTVTLKPFPVTTEL